jgi:protocatechuate 3,4-dioxygenase beta subunit
MERRLAGLAAIGLLFALVMAALYGWAMRGPTPAVAPSVDAVAEETTPTRAKPSAPRAPRRAPIRAPSSSPQLVAPETTPEPPTEAPLPYMTLRGRVVDESGSGIAGAMVTVSRGSGVPRRDPSGGDGAFSISMPGEAVTVWAERADGLLRARSSEVAIDGSEGGTWDLELVVPTRRTGGLGVGVAKDEGGVRVTTVHPGTPADRMGLDIGDIIVEVDGEPTAGMRIEDFISRMTGEEGTKVLFKVRDPDGSEHVEELTREVLQPNPDR